MVLDMLKNNLRNYLYAREQWKRNIYLYFLNYLSAWLFFMPIMPHCCNWSCSNQSNKNVSYHVLPKDENLNLVAKNYS